MPNFCTCPPVMSEVLFSFAGKPPSLDQKDDLKYWRFIHQYSAVEVCTHPYRRSESLPNCKLTGHSPVIITARYTWSSCLRAKCSASFGTVLVLIKVLERNVSGTPRTPQHYVLLVLVRIEIHTLQPVLPCSTAFTRKKVLLG